MTKLMNRFRHAAGKTWLMRDERGLSTVEYVIILVLIAAAAVGVWSTFGATIKAKIGSANDEIDVKVQINSNGNTGESE